MSNQKRSGEHVRRVQELRRSNAAGAHSSNKYDRVEKYPIRSVHDYMEAWYGENGVFDIDELMELGFDDADDGETAECVDDNLV
jgi:hypothetical protein